MPASSSCSAASPPTDPLRPCASYSTPRIARWPTHRPGIFALGTASHAYLEFDASGEAAPADLVQAVASLREPRTTMGGVNLVAGFRPELWRDVAPEDAPPTWPSFNATGRRGGRVRDAGDAARRRPLALRERLRRDLRRRSRRRSRALAGIAHVAEESSSWPYRHDLDLTGLHRRHREPDAARGSASSSVDRGDVARRRRHRAAPAEMGTRLRRLGGALRSASRSR